MSCQIVRKIKFDEPNNSIKITHASSNELPKTYYTSEYIKSGELFKEELKHLFFSIMQGNYRLNKNTGEVKGIIDGCILCKNTLGDVFDFDLNYNTTFNSQVNQILYEGLFEKRFYNQEVDSQSIIVLLDNVKKQMSIAKELFENKLREEGKLKVRGASMSFVYKDYDVFISENGDETILSPQKNYHNDGILDNSNDDAIFLGEGTKVLWDFIRFNGFYDGEYTKKEIIDKLVEYYGQEKRKVITTEYNVRFQLVERIVTEKLSHLTMSKLPYLDFNKN